MSRINEVAMLLRSKKIRTVKDILKKINNKELEKDILLWIEFRELYSFDSGKGHGKQELRDQLKTLLGIADSLHSEDESL